MIEKVLKCLYENIWAILTTYLPKLKSEIQKFLK